MLKLILLYALMLCFAAHAGPILSEDRDKRMEGELLITDNALSLIVEGVIYPVDDVTHVTMLKIYNLYSGRSGLDDKLQIRSVPNGLLCNVTVSVSCLRHEYGPSSWAPQKCLTVHLKDLTFKSKKELERGTANGDRAQGSDLSPGVSSSENSGVAEN